MEYAQQRVRLRLLERQEQLMRIARDISNQELERAEFVNRAEALISQYPELQAITWIDERRKIRASHAAPTLSASSCGWRASCSSLERPQTPTAWPATCSNRFTPSQLPRRGCVAPCCNCRCL